MIVRQFEMLILFALLIIFKQEKSFVAFADFRRNTKVFPTNLLTNGFHYTFDTGEIKL